jgi:hypothetical protein
MTKGRRKSVFRLAGAVLILLLIAIGSIETGGIGGCGTGPGTTVSGGNPAAPPAPPAEIPAALRFPSDLSIDVNTIASESNSSALAALVGSGGQFSEEISFAANLMPGLNQLVNDTLQPLPQFDIPVSTSTITFETVIDTKGGAQIDIKIDFADFDLDGDGLNEGCVGHTAGLPICFRIWFSGVQRMAGLFTKFPTEDNLGAGEYRTVIRGETGPDLYIAVTYDHSDPLVKSTEFFEKVVPPGAPIESDSALPNFHVQTSQEGPDAIARKTLKMSIDNIEPDFSNDVTGTPADFKYIGRWREDNDFWSGSDTSQNIDIQNFSDICALISTGNPSNELNCVDMGIDVADIPFLDFLTTEDIRLPADFPASPTFP